MNFLLKSQTFSVVILIYLKRLWIIENNFFLLIISNVDKIKIKQRDYLLLKNTTFEETAKNIFSFAYFVEHVEVQFKPSEIYSDENLQKVLTAIELLETHTKKILKLVSLNTIHIWITSFNKTFYIKYSWLFMPKIVKENVVLTK